MDVLLLKWPTSAAIEVVANYFGVDVDKAGGVFLLASLAGAADVWSVATR